MNFRIPATLELNINQYTKGRVGKRNVVLVLLSVMGKASAAGPAASFWSSYTQLELVLLVARLLRTTFGRRYLEEFKIKDTIEDSLRRPVWLYEALWLCSRPNWDGTTSEGR
ncbi:hypothetical protein BGZ63DRAFT_425141 [Mariannaea sp. PMI_226]|nr:hypothetical protein BGZ63DRAFT_425141 [Mariannaea sp. PMI_226]